MGSLTYSCVFATGIFNRLRYDQQLSWLMLLLNQIGVMTERISSSRRSQVSWLPDVDFRI
jgi:hypothetical protein